MRARRRDRRARGEPLPAGFVWIALAALGALLAAGAAVADASEWRLLRPDTALARPHRPTPRPSPVCNLVRADSRLGLWRWESGLRVPARRTADPRAASLRLGEAQPLAEGALRALPAAASLAGSVPYQDTLRVLIVRIEFETDRDGSLSSGNGRFDLSPPDTVNVPVDPTPHGRAYTMAHGEALRRYYEVTTHGRLVLEYDVYPPTDGGYRASDMANFGPWEFSQEIFDRAYAMFRAFAVAADTQDVSIPWAQYDRVIFQHAGSDLQSDTRQDSPRDIPTFTIGLPDSLAIPLADTTVYLQAGMVLPETTNQDGFFAALNAVLAHEAGHLFFGWRDVYDIFTGLPTVGVWSLMDTGNLTGTIVRVGSGSTAQQFFAIGVLPPLTDPYQMHLVWDDVPFHDPPVYGAIDSLSPPQLSRRAIKVPLSSEEYLLLENRRVDLNGDNNLVLVRDPATKVILGPGTTDSLEYDFLLPGDGILAWHVDESIVAFDPPGRRSDDFFSLNGNRDRFGLQIFEADALDDLGDFSSPFALGSPFDPFFVPNNSRLAPGGRPPLTTNSKTNPHVAVDFLDTLRLSMRLRVSREWAVDGWPVIARPGPHGLDPLVLDFAAGRRVVYSGADSALHARAPSGAPAGVMGDVLWQGPASLSRVASLALPTGVYALAVYPDPEGLGQDSGALGGSTIVAVNGSGVPATGFPRAVGISSGDGRCRWATSPPLVIPGLTAPVVVTGARCGAVWAYEPSTSTETEIDRAASAVLALAAIFEQGVAYVASADSLGHVEVARWPISPPAAPSSSGTGVSLPVAGSWVPRVAWVEMSSGAGGQEQGSGAGLPELVVLDRASGRGWLLAVDDTGNLRVISELLGIDTPLAEGPAAGDLDGDGFHEVVLATEEGRVGFWNLSGGATPGWPAPFEREAFPTRAAPAVADLDGAPGLEIVHATGGGRVFALDRERRPLAGWPLGSGAGQVSSPALLDLEGDGALELLLADADSLLYAYHTGADATGAVWPVWGGSPTRNFALTDTPISGSVAGGGLLSPGTLVAYPNPAKRQPVVVSFALTEPAQVRLAIFDTSGREVARLEQGGLRSDNHLVWDPSGAAPGVYVGRLELEGGGRSETHLVHLGVLH